MEILLLSCLHHCQLSTISEIIAATNSCQQLSDFLRYIASADRKENTASKISSIVAGVSVAVDMYLLSRCLETVLIPPYRYHVTVF
jgi:hypothetical protein